MITKRPLIDADLLALQKSLDESKFHSGLKANLFSGPHTESFVYEDEQGPIGVLRYSKTLRLCTSWFNEKDRVRNGASIFQAIKDSVELAKKNGFTDIIFDTESLLLEKFCIDKLGFEKAVGNTLVLYVGREKEQ